MRYEGYIDALSQTGETIKLAMDLLMPFYSAAASIGWFFIPWFALFAVAWVAFKLAGRQAKPAELLRPVSIFAAIAICLIPVPPSATDFDRPFGVGPYLTYSVLKSFNDLVTETITVAQTKAMGGQPVPLTALRTMNQEYANLFKDSDLNPLLNDYWGNCTVGVVDLNKRSPQHYQAVGLLGPGLLGLQPSDISASQEYLRQLNSDDGPSQYVRRSPGAAALFDPPDNNRANWAELRSDMRSDLEVVAFPNGTGRTYRIPKAAEWKSRMGVDVDPDADGQGNSSRFMTLDDFGDRQEQFINPEVYQTVYGPNSVPGAEHDPTQFWSDNCWTLFQLSHTGLNEWYKAVQARFNVPAYEVSEVLHEFEPFEAATSRAAFAGGLQTFHDGSLAKRLNNSRQGAAMNGLDPSGDTYSEATGDFIAEIQSFTQMITSFFLELNLDQWVLTLIGSLGLAIAFLLILFPFFAPFAFMSSAGENAITVIFKVIVMLQLTLTLAFVIASIGASIMMVVNAYAATAYEGDGLSTMSIGALAVTINTACLIFPLYAAKLAYLALFGSMGVSGATGQTISAGAMAMTTVIAGAIAGRGASTVSRPVTKSIQRSNQQQRMEKIASASAGNALRSSDLNRRMTEVDKRMERHAADRYRDRSRGGLRSDLSSPQSNKEVRPDRSGRYTSNTSSSAADVSSKDFRGDDNG